jgi:hypothetical protein
MNPNLTMAVVQDRQQELHRAAAQAHVVAASDGCPTLLTRVRQPIAKVRRALRSPRTAVAARNTVPTI